MANWSDLKAAVAEVIKTNGNNEITGQILQNALSSIISNLGENATFAGIATPTTNPGVPDGPVFYLASQSGTYSNFNTLELPFGNIGIFKNTNGSWELNTISIGSISEINISNTYPTEGSDNTNKYTLETAIAKIPLPLRVLGIKCSFLNKDERLETWEYQGGEFTSTDSWLQVGAMEFSNILKESLSAANSIKTGSQEKDISSSAIRWKDGLWNYTKSESEGSSYQKNTFKHGFFNVSTYDKIAIANTGFNGSSSSTAEDILPNISLYSGNTPLTYLHGEENADVELDLTPYAQYPDLIAIISVKKDAEFSITTSSEGLLPQIETLEEKVGDLTNLKVKVDGIDKDIFSELQWTKGTWTINEEHPNGCNKGYHIINKIWHTDKIDISYYEYITCRELLNGQPLSTSTDYVPGISIYGDGNFVDQIQNAVGINTIYRSDYAQYEKLEAIFQCKSTSDDEFISIYDTSSIKVFRTPVSSGTSIPKRIVIVGDSLCGNRNALIVQQFNAILAAQGYDPIISRANGGENAIGNLTRAGGLGIRVKTAFDIPTSGTVSCELQSAWMKSDGTYADNPYNTLNGDGAKVSICGVTGYIQKTSSGYTFTRSEPGEVVKVGQGAIIYDSAIIDDKDYVHIWFTGQNGGYEDEKDWADMVKSATMNFNDRFIVCSTPHERTTPELVRQANIHFGCRYLNLRDYTQGQAVYDGQRLGIIDSGYTADDYKQLFWPGSDKVHQNNLLSYIWAVKMWNLMLELGFVEGTRIETGEYYTGES